MAYYLIGGRGRLGRAIAAEYGSSEIVSLDRTVYEGWSRDGAANQVARYFEQQANGKATVFVASGLLDPNLPQQELLRVNYTLPKNVIDGAAKLGIKVITFGTVMEGLLQSNNPYIHSKTKLSEYVKMMANEHQPTIHIQQHTLYGIGRPSSFMFLGQILASIQTNKPFRMTSGFQLREYHHLADEATAIRRIADLSLPGVVDLSHGKPISLRTLAKNIFDAFGKSNLLRLGALPDPPEENYDQIFRVNEVIQDTHFRDSLLGIIEYMQRCYVHKQTEP